MLLAELDFSLPLTNPVVIFSVVLFIILFAPILLNKIKVPHIIGLIIAGIIVGPYGVNLLSRDSSIVLFGTVGLLYIMFMAGLEIDILEFKKNTIRCLLLGLFTFVIPISIGFSISYYFLGYGLLTSILFSSTFASSTMVSYPIISKYGLSNNRAVTITVGGTMVTDLLTLLVLAIIVGMAQGGLTSAFWIRLSVSIVIACAIIVFLFPLIARWFFKRIEDGISQYIFVLAMVFSGGMLAELAGIEPIIGAFLSGLSLNKFIPHHSALMNRISFVGNALFIPFFLVGVGMLVNVRAAFLNWETMLVAAVMVGGALSGKFLAAMLSRRVFRLTKQEGLMVFGLSSAQAAATLATVLVGYNIILGETPNGEPIRLLNENILNASILLILVSCTVSSVLVEKTSKKILASEGEATREENNVDKTLLSVKTPETASGLIDLALMITPKSNKEGILALNVVEGTDTGDGKRKASEKMLDAIIRQGAASEVAVKAITRFDQDVPNGILYTSHEHKATDILLSVTNDHADNKRKITKGATTDIGVTTQRILLKNENTVWIYNCVQPFNTLRKIILAASPDAEAEEGFVHWVNKILLLCRNSGLPLTIYSNSATKQNIRIINENSSKPLNIEFVHLDDWSEFLIICRELNPNDIFLIVSSRKGGLSYDKQLDRLPHYLTKYFQQKSYILLYPQQSITYSKLNDIHQEDNNLIDLLSEGRKIAGRAGSFIGRILLGKGKNNNNN